ncbi:hypothetical protein BKA62DRAFT_678919 [Auriculariales sp. MPI-PUGE-AT-0066]|nr:hypothetical protein BKA62DRAFT_678919 [Auriculariales sp. MPI-PUGE-AT-0066]
MSNAVPLDWVHMAVKEDVDEPYSTYVNPRSATTHLTTAPGFSDDTMPPPPPADIDNMPDIVPPPPPASSDDTVPASSDDTVPPPAATSDPQQPQWKAGKEAPTYKESSPKSQNIPQLQQVSERGAKEQALSSLYCERRHLPEGWNRQQESLMFMTKTDVFPSDLKIPTITVYRHGNAADLQSFAAEGSPVIWDGDGDNNLAEVLSNYYAEHKWVEIQVPGVFAGQQLRRLPGTKDNYWMLRSTFTDCAESSDTPDGINMLSTTTVQPDSHIQMHIIMNLNFIFDTTCDALPVFTLSIPANQLNFVIAVHTWSYSGLHIDASGQPTTVRMIQGKKIWTVVEHKPTMTGGMILRTGKSRK